MFENSEEQRSKEGVEFDIIESSTQFHHASQNLFVPSVPLPILYDLSSLLVDFDIIFQISHVCHVGPRA